MLLVRLAARVGRHAEPAAQREAGALVVELHRVGDEFVAEHRGDACVTSPLVECRRMIRERASRGQQAEADVEPAERESLDQSLDLRQLGALGAQELAPRRHVEEQVAHLDRRARRVRLRHGLADDAVRRRDRARDRRVGLARDDSHARHRGDARQRLAAEAERAHRLEVLDPRQLARRVPREREHQFVGRDAGSVVAHAAQCRTAALDLDLDGARARVEAVLDQFLDHGRRALDDLAGRDLVDQLLGEDPDRHRRGALRRGREDSKPCALRDRRASRRNPQRRRRG